MGELAYINGTFCEPREAMISIDDRGFQFGDGVYEVVAAFGNRLFRVEEHLDRLRCSMASIGITADPDELSIKQAMEEGVQRAKFDETLAYIQITRGVQPRNHAYADNLVPTVIMTFRPRTPVNPQKRMHGLHVKTIDDFRWSRCDIKTTALLPNVMAKNQALRDGYDDAVFVGPHGDIREATAANIFIVKDGRLITPGVDGPILHGITRKHVLECAHEADVESVEARLTVNEVISADEVFLSSTSVDILAVTRVNHTPIADGKPGAVTERLYEAFVALCSCT